MATNPLGKGTRNVSSNVDDVVHAEITDLARQSGLSVSAYIAGVLAEASKRKWKVKREFLLTDSSTGESPHVAEIVKNPRRIRAVRGQ